MTAPAPAAAAPHRAQVRPVVALLDGGPDDAEVVDVALAACVGRGSELRLVYASAHADGVPTPLSDAFEREYASGALAVARCVPGVHASAICLPGLAVDALRPELVCAEMLVVSAAAATAMIDAVRATGDDGRRCPVTSVEAAPTGSERLRLGYRLALLRELEPARERRDGSTTPEELDDAWHVGVACPPLEPETIDAWAACSSWPLRTRCGAAG